MKTQLPSPSVSLQIQTWFTGFWCCALVLLALTPARAAIDYSPPYTFTTIAGSAGHGTADGIGTNAQFYEAAGMTMDGAGNLYVSDTGNSTIRKMSLVGTNWVVSTVAGNAAGTGTNNGTGSAALFNNPIGIALGTNGDFYVADANNHAIRIVTPQGVVTTLAGVPGTSGTNDSAQGAAEFDEPYGVVVDKSGSVFVADTGNGRIREVTPEGVVTTIAGSANNVNVKDGTNGSALFDGPIAITMDVGGNLYVADEDSDTIRRVSPVGPNWVVTTLAGKTNTLGSADGTNSTARFSGPVGVSVDAATNIYVTDFGNDTIRRVSPVGTNWVVTTLAGKTNTVGTANGTNTTARFNTPVGIYVDTATNLYIGDYGNSLVRRVSPLGTNWVVSTLAGVAGGSGTNNGPGSVAQFSFPAGLAFDPGGNLYVADEQNDAIRKMSLVAGSWVVTNLAGLEGTNGSGNGTGTGARFYFPSSVAVDRGSNVYVADELNDLIRKVTPAGVVSTVAGTAGTSGTNDGTGTAARFNQPIGIAVDAATNLYVADTSSSSIRKITPAGVVRTIAGLPTITGSSDGTNSGALFTDPTGIVVDSATNLYVADFGNNEIRKISPVGTNWVVTTLAGQAGILPPTDGDGTNTTATFSGPEAIARDGAGNLYVLDYSAAAVRKMTPQGPNWVVTTLAGVPGTAGYSDGTAGNVQFDNPFGIAVDTSGDVYVSDGGNNCIRKGVPASSVASPLLHFPGRSPSQFNFGITGNTGLTLDIQSSVDMVNWQTIGNGYLLVGGTNFFIDPSPTTGNLYYRAQVR